MNILVVEDNPERIKWFNQNLIGHEFIIAEDSIKAKRLVSEMDFDLIFFDHDLGLLENVESECENTGYQVAKFMKEKKYNLFANKIIHSLNMVGAIRIQQLLTDAKICPFTLLKHKISEFINA